VWSTRLAWVVELAHVVTVGLSVVGGVLKLPQALFKGAAVVLLF